MTPISWVWVSTSLYTLCCTSLAFPTGTRAAPSPGDDEGWVLAMLYLCICVSVTA